MDFRHVRHFWRRAGPDSGYNHGIPDRRHLQIRTVFYVHLDPTLLRSGSDPF